MQNIAVFNGGRNAAVFIWRNLEGKICIVSQKILDFNKINRYNLMLTKKCERNIHPGKYLISHPQS